MEFSATTAVREHVQDLGAVYGSFGAILVLLLWLWISCFALLAGALVDRLRAEASSPMVH